ncbi:MAG: hypothetical protein EXR99_01990 [Gemmataceae bacterium]|nr:hypothetical protein [Gemmataceae bacterium]
MNSNNSIFLDIALPNASTWFYFSLLLASALFFKFTRVFSMRNLDILGIFFFMPGLLFLLEGKADARTSFAWLLGACLYWLVRCLIDLLLERRPAFSPNLNVPAMVWLSVAFYLSLVAVAIREPDSPGGRDPRMQTPIDKVREKGEKIIENRGGQMVSAGSVRLWLERGLSLICHLAIGVGLVLFFWLHYENYHLGFGAATLYFLLPYTYLLMPYAGLKVGRWDHSFLMALMIWALVFHKRPMVAAAFMGVAFGGLFFPLVLLPLWTSYFHGRARWRFLAMALGVFVISAGAFVSFYGGSAESLASTWMVSDWIPWKEPLADTQSFWHGIHWAYRLPVSLVFLAFAVSVFFWPNPKNLGELVALSAALLIGIQFWYSHLGGIYILWYLPLLLMVIFRPSLGINQVKPA